MRQAGVVKWFDEAKGYGFITPAGGGPDIFIHYSNIQVEGFKTLAKGQQVSFESFVGSKGPSALSVEVVGGVIESSGRARAVKSAVIEQSEESLASEFFEDSENI